MNFARMQYVLPIFKKALSTEPEIVRVAFYFYDGEQGHEGPITFDELTEKQYMIAYNLILDEFESKLSDSVPAELYQWVSDTWFETIKPAMQASKLYDNDLSIHK
ncbi:hypothetical protein VQ643_15145 [Pseudomonas sp. F1_0610]|uniref:hypothetical protein n=1 Tax=Pseudomonas sp. F1_0610 TaxID=3114284 RepID=UPI0039C4D30E